MDGNLDKLLLDNVSVIEKYNIFLDTVKLLQEVESDISYTWIIKGILPNIEKITERFEREHCFDETEMREYAKKYKEFLEEYRKYQVCLVGDAKDCQQVKELLEHKKVHIFDGGDGDTGIIKNSDYVIICSLMPDERVRKIGKGTVIRYDFLRMCAWQISPETMHLDMKLRDKINMGIEGAVTGLSYEQRGINYEKIGKNLACLAAPSQDLFVDYHSFLWLYQEVARQRKGIIKYCVIGMDYYRFWYDLSLSKEGERMLCFYGRIGRMHNYHAMDGLVAGYKEYQENCAELMVRDYMEKDYCNTFHPERVYVKDKQQYKMSEEAYKRDSEEIKKVFHKPYPGTFEENVGILECYLKFLNLHNVKALIYIPPFPRIFNEFTSVDMKNTTLDVLSRLAKMYEFDMLDLSEDGLFSNEHFSDWSHLNCYGADLATELLNGYMEEIWG